MTLALAALRKYWPALLIAAMLVGSHYYTYRHGVSTTQLKADQAWAERDAGDAAALVTAEQTARLEEQRRAQWAEGVQRDATQALEQARTDADGASADAGRLRDELAKLQARLGRTGASTSAPVSCASTTRAAMVLSQLLEGSSRREQELAKAFDGSRIAGLACERAYDGLTAGGNSVSSN